MKRGCLILLIASMVVLCSAVVGVSFLLRQSPATPPSVLINSPRNGERVAVGQEMIIHATARGDTQEKIRRVELWVDGKLQDAQGSNLPGGISPFPIVANWRPPTPGAHTVIVRAFNMHGKHAQASINVEAVQSGDRDNDGVPDANDACPDQPGSPATRGCPAPSANDRDGDGITDSTDACPDQPGSPLAQGCPDADNDGVRDSDDACPREAGPRANNGCPLPGDADADGVPDASDACPREPGSAGTRGCPDNDGDGIADRDDACPAAPGASGQGGCPDRDGDGVRDPADLCPDVPGAASNSGCPASGAGDRDGDGVDDGTDLAPDAPGAADSGGAPAPGGGSDPAGDSVPGAWRRPFGDMGGDEAVNLVRLDALEFSVTQDYDQVYCYAGVVGREMERYGPFNPLGRQQWDIAEYVGGANSRTLGVVVGQPLQLRIECGAYADMTHESGGAMGTGGGSAAYYSLGSITRSYDISQWDGHVITERSGGASSERGAAGHSFQVKFRLCLRSCESAAFPPPTLSLRRERIFGFIELRYLGWTWDGDRRNITGFRLYVNGNRRATIRDANANQLNLREYAPPCGERYEYYLTAFQEDGIVVRESPPSNRVYLAGETCPRRVKVTFEQIGFSDMHYIGGDMAGRGPLYGAFFASGSNTQTLQFDGGSCWAVLWIFSCRGYNTSGGNSSITSMFAQMREEGYAPSDNYVIVELNRDDDLTFGGSIWDEEAYGDDHRLFNARHTLRASETLPIQVTLEDSTELGRLTLRIRVEEISAP